MSMRRQGGRGRPSTGRRQGAPRRGVFWQDTLVNETLTNNETAGVGLDQGIPEDEIKGLTVTRTIIRLSVQAVTQDTSGLFHCGIYLVENDAAAALAFAEAQDPADDAGWMYRLMAHVWGQSGNVANSINFSRINEDIRAMRKYPGEDYTNILLVTNTSAGGSINVDGMVRTLYKRA